MFRKKELQPLVVVDAYDMQVATKAMQQLNDMYNKTGVYVGGGSLYIYDESDATSIDLGPVFYHAPRESYVIEWNR